MHPDEYLAIVSKSANARKKRSLEAIHEVCREQHERGSKNFSISVVARLSAERGGPKERTIRNPTGATYRGLISEWARFSGGNTKHVAASKEGPFEDILSRIVDDGLRVYIGERLTELRGLRHEINILKAQIRKEKTVVVDLRAHTRVQPGVTSADVMESSVEVLPPMQLLTPTERSALEYAITTFIEENGYTARKNGRLVNEHGRSILPPGFISAIEKALSHTGRAR